MYSRKLGITQDGLMDKLKQKNSSEEFGNLIRAQYKQKMGEPNPVRQNAEKTAGLSFDNPASVETFKNDLSDKIQSLSQTAKSGIADLAKHVDLDDIVIIALIVFLLCDKTENDVVLLAILMFVLFS